MAYFDFDSLLAGVLVVGGLLIIAGFVVQPVAYDGHAMT